VHIYIGFETLKVKCTQYGICSQATFKNARTMFFGRGRRLFSGGFEKISCGGKNFAGGLPPPPPRGSNIPISLWGYLTSSVENSMSAYQRTALGTRTRTRTRTRPYPRVWVGYGCNLSSMGGCGWVHIHVIQWPRGPPAASWPQRS
jgi:hypothetical protein